MGANEKSEATYHGSSQASPTPEPEAPKKGEMGPVGRWFTGIVCLAIVTPFIGILWAWAAEVVRSFG